MDTALFSLHSPALNSLYGDLENGALGQREVFVGTAGSVVERENAEGFRFYAHQYYGATGKRVERYVAGPVESAEADAAAEALRMRILETKERVPSLRLLGREGFAVVNAKAYAVIASLHNHRLFEAGATLVGSHAFGVIVNRLGVRATAWTTTDIDIARGAALALDQEESDFLGMLRGSGIDFREVPEFDRKRPSSSFKEPGRSTFVVDLLVPAGREGLSTVEVAELRAHATAIPYLGYLLAETQIGLLLAREGCCSVRVPLPERFAAHKLIVSRLRTGRQAKSAKDLLQACVLAAALAETHPGAMESALAEIPQKARRHVTAALREAGPLLARYPRALAELGLS